MKYLSSIALCCILFVTSAQETLTKDQIKRTDNTLTINTHKENLYIEFTIISSKVLEDGTEFIEFYGDKCTVSWSESWLKIECDCGLNRFYFFRW